MQDAEKATSALASELEQCRTEGIAIAVWWRNDDVTRLNNPLERLLVIAEDVDATIDLAVIPALVGPALARQLAPTKSYDVMQHGFRHLNHSGEGILKNEFGPGRDVHGRLADLQEGHSILGDLFEDKFIPILAPPWNRIDDALIEWLPSIGLNCLSRYAEHVRPLDGPTPVNLDVQIDLYDWGRGRSLNLCEMTDLMVQRIRANRSKSDKHDLTIGLLTHHELHNPEFASGLSEFLQLLLKFPGVSLSSARRILIGRAILGNAPA